MRCGAASCSFQTFQPKFPSEKFALPFNLVTMSVFEPGDAIYLELWMIGVIVSAVVYGGVLFLSLSYIPLLLKTSNDISRRMRNFLLIYVTLMVTFSTVYLITMIFTLTRAIFSYPYHSNSAMQSYLFQNGLVGSMCTTFASWGADGFMVSKNFEICRRI